MDQIASGGSHSCGISDGAVYCWGRNVGSRLGMKATEMFTPAPVEVEGTPLEGKTVERIEAHRYATCALTSEGQLSCWGSNYRGVNGSGDAASAPRPRAVATAGTPLGGTRVVDFAVGERSACALTATNVVACWGDNPDGLLGVGDAEPHLAPAPVVVAGTVLEGKTIVDISIESTHACAVTSDGMGACWGQNRYYGLGDGTTVDALAPVRVETAGTVLEGKALTQIVAGDYQSCALAADSTIACWGGGTSIPRPVEVDRTGTPLAGKTIAELTRASRTTCARSTDGVVACWGSNTSYQLGVPTPGTYATPVSPTLAGTPLAGAAVTHIDPGIEHTCATTDARVGVCWGSNADGQLGRAGVAGGYLPAALSYGPPGGASAVSVTPGPGRALVRWGPPDSTGGYPTTGYRIYMTWAQGLGARVVPIEGGTTSSVVVRGLPTNWEVTFSVAAENEKGTGFTSRPSVKATLSMPTSPYAPEASWAAWVARQHRDVLGRDPSPAESATWVSRLTATPTDKGAMVDALRRSAASTQAVDPAVRLYRAFLGRAPDVSGLEFWIGRRRAGTWTLVRMADHFAASSEFLRKYGTLSDEQFVRRIYVDVLGRAADPSGVAYWTGRLSTKARSRGSVMVGFSESSEYQRKQAENTDLAVAYALLLGRQPDGAEAADWVASQKAGMAHADLLREVLDSVEYTKP